MARALALVVIAFSIPILLAACATATPQAEEDVPRGQGPRQGFGLQGENSLTAVAADELGMTVEELTGELENGKSITDLANERGVDPQIIADALMAQRAEDLAQSVAEGSITQEQADQMLQRMEERGLDASFSGPPAGFEPPEGRFERQPE